MYKFKFKKRSEISVLFDLFGLVGPFVVIVKIFMQKLLRLIKQDWDIHLPIELENNWSKKIQEI